MRHEPRDLPDGVHHVAGPLAAVIGRLELLADLGVEASPRVAADLCEAPTAEVEALARAGVVSTTRIKGHHRPFVNVGEVARALAGEGGRP